MEVYKKVNQHNDIMNRPYNQKKEPLPQLSIARLEQLRALFVQKNWPVEEYVEPSVFERFYKTLSMLNDSEQDFLIELTFKFDHIPLSDYLSFMKGPLQQLRNDAGIVNLLFVTCTPKEDVGSVKSSSTVLYQLKGTTIKQQVNLNPYVVVDNITRIPLYKIDKDTKIVLVDDFVGTGDTAVAAIDYIHELLLGKTDNAQIVVFCIVALRQGIDRLNGIGVKTYYAIERKKAISEEMKAESRDAANSLMRGIENRIKKLKPAYRFGYKGSEALVCLERCPNNTFPIYWLTKNVAPYER